MNLLFGVFLFIMVPFVAVAGNSIPADLSMGEHSRCNRHFAYFERAHNIPGNLLKAVSITETGIWHQDMARLVPWPWAINFQGKSHYFRSKKEAVAEVTKLMEQGHKSIDVGCMQINLYYHPEAFKNLEEAFEPRSNIAYGASFLRNHFEKSRNWHDAVASYHSEVKVHGTPYAKRVMSHWKTITEPVKMDLETKFKRQLKRSTKSYQTSYKKPQTRHYLGVQGKRIRRNSDMFIRVSPMPKSAKRNEMMESITQDVLTKFN